MKTKQEKAQYDMDYQKKHMSRVTVWFNLEKDKNLLEWMNNSGVSKSELIKQALRHEMERDGDRL